MKSLELFVGAAGIDEATHVISSAHLAELCFIFDCSGCKNFQHPSTALTSSYKLIKFKKIVSQGHNFVLRRGPK